MARWGLLGNCWKRLGGIGLALALVIGCRTPPPTLRPPTQPEEYNLPPQEARYNNKEWPREVTEGYGDDMGRKVKDDLNVPGGKAGGMNPGGMRQAGGP
jgi:hypothetical protein